MSEFDCRRTGRAYQIGEQLDRDGHAVVHAVGPASSDLALKRYLPGTLSRRPDLEARIKAMITHPPAYRTDRSGSVICAWPEDAAYITRQFTGFVMPHIDTRGARTVHDVATSPHTTRRDRTSSSDIFPLAVQLHLLLLPGGHPFRGRWSGRGDRPAEHLLAQDGLWAYAGDRRLDPDPGAVPPTVLPETLQQ